MGRSLLRPAHFSFNAVCPTVNQLTSRSQLAGLEDVELNQVFPHHVRCEVVLNVAPD